MGKQVVELLNSIKLSGSYIEQLIKLLLAYAFAMFVSLYVGGLLENIFVHLIRGYSLGNPFSFITNVSPYILYKRSYLAKLLCLLSGIPFLYLFLKLTQVELAQRTKIVTSSNAWMYLLASPYACLLLRQLTSLHKPVPGWYVSIGVVYILLCGVSIFVKSNPADKEKALF